MADNFNQNKKPGLRVDTRMLHYIVIGMIVVNTLTTFILYRAIITPPLPLDQQVANLVKQNEQLYNMKQNIKQVVK